MWSLSSSVFLNSLRSSDKGDSGSTFLIFTFHSYKESSTSHSLIRGVLIQSCSTGAQNFTKYVFFHVQFNGQVENTPYHRAIFTLILPMPIITKIINFIVKNIVFFLNFTFMAHRYGVFLCWPLNCTWKNTYLVKFWAPVDQTVLTLLIWRVFF